MRRTPPHRRRAPPPNAPPPRALARKEAVAVLPEPPLLARALRGLRRQLRFLAQDGDRLDADLQPAGRNELFFERWEDAHGDLTAERSPEVAVFEEGNRRRGVAQDVRARRSGSRRIRRRDRPAASAAAIASRLDQRYQDYQRRPRTA